jgi:hypothetical protein
MWKEGRRGREAEGGSCADQQVLGADARGAVAAAAARIAVGRYMQAAAVRQPTEAGNRITAILYVDSSKG